MTRKHLGPSLLVGTLGAVLLGAAHWILSAASYWVFALLQALDLTVGVPEWTWTVLGFTMLLALGILGVQWIARRAA